MAEAFDAPLTFCPQRGLEIGSSLVFLTKGIFLG